MDCFQDFCLNCDREAAGGLYCSQSCRLADLEKANSRSIPTSMTAPARSPTALAFGNRAPITPARTNDWSRAYTPPSSKEDRNSQMSSYFMRTSTSRPESQDQRALTPSSSRSSLSSNSGSSTHISEQAKQELQEYYNALDHAKASSKRRQSTW